MPLNGEPICHVLIQAIMSASAARGNASKGKRIPDLFYTRCEDDSTQCKCKWEIEGKQEGTGYTDLISHKISKHPENYKTLTSEKLSLSSRSESVLPTSMFYSQKVVNIQRWLEYVIHGLLPFSVAENVQYRKHVKNQPISVKSFRKYMDLLTSKVEAKFSALLPNKFGIVFDGLSQGDTHYIAVFATYSAETLRG